MVDESTEALISSFGMTVGLTDTAAELDIGFDILIWLMLSRCKVNKSQTWHMHI